MSAKIGRRRTDPGTQPNAELNLAEIFRAKGDPERAQDQFDSVYRYWKNPSSSLWMRFRYSIRMFAGMGGLALARGDLASAKLHATECLALAERTNSRKNLVKGWRLAGDIARAERDWDTAERHLRKSQDLAVSLGNPVQQWKTEIALGHLLQDTGRAPESQHAFQRAFGVMQQVRQTLREERLRVAFEKNSDLRLVQDRLASI